MAFVVNSRKARSRDRVCGNRFRIFVDSSTATSVYTAVEMRIVDMELSCIDSDNWAFLETCKHLRISSWDREERIVAFFCTIFVVHPLNFPQIGAIFDNIVVELIPRADRCQLWTGELAQGVEVEVVDTSQQAVCYKFHQTHPHADGDWIFRSENELEHNSSLGVDEG